MRKLFYLMMLIVIFGLIMPGCIFHVVPPLGQDGSIDIVKDDTSYKTSLIAGQHTIAGSITVSNDDENLFVTYETVDNWLINETHLYVGTTIPTNSAPGKFPYKHEELGGVKTNMYEIPLEDLGIEPCDTIYIAAHAELFKGKTEETGWAEGVEIEPGKNWAMYFEYDIPCDFIISRMAISKFLEYSKDYGEEQARQMTVDWLEIQSEVEDAGIGEDGTTIWFEYKNGGIVAILTHDITQKKTIVEGTSSSKLSLSKELFSISNRVMPLSKRAISLDAFAALFGESAPKIQDILSEIGYTCEYAENTKVSVELMRNLYKYGVVFINTHGGVTKDGQVVIATGLKMTEELREKYKKEIDSNDLVEVWVSFLTVFKRGPYFGISPSFIKNNASESYPRSLIYIDACYSYINNSMAKAFVDKGAYVYCGWSRQIYHLADAIYQLGVNVFENLAYDGMIIQDAISKVNSPYAPWLFFAPWQGYNFCLIEGTCTINASAGLNGSISPFGDVILSEGSDQSFTITPDNGYIIDDVLVDGNSVGAVNSYTFTNVNEDHTISATFNAMGTGPVHNLTKDTYYNTIQESLNDADSLGGDTIEVADGTYIENVDVNKDHLTIKSENGAETTIVQAANSNDHVFEVTANYVNISGFTISGTISYPASGIYLNTADYCDLCGNIISDNCCPIFLEYSSSNTIASNKVFKNEVGIQLLYSNNNMFASNEVFLNEGACGLYLYESNSNTIEGNILSENSFGIDIDFSSNNNIVNNSILNNWCAISLDLGTNSNILSNNVISSNSYTITTAESADNNEIYSNNFIENSENVYDYYGTNIWNSSEEITYTYNGTTYTNYLGNYWDDYTGEDTDNDGIGDTPYSIDSDQDSYPLISPFENYY